MASGCFVCLIGQMIAMRFVNRRESSARRDPEQSYMYGQPRITSTTSNIDIPTIRTELGHSRSDMDRYKAPPRAHKALNLQHSIATTMSMVIRLPVARTSLGIFSCGLALGLWTFGFAYLLITKCH